MLDLLVEIFNDLIIISHSVVPSDKAKHSIVIIVWFDSVFHLDVWKSPVLKLPNHFLVAFCKWI